MSRSNSTYREARGKVGSETQEELSASREEECHIDLAESRLPMSVSKTCC